MSRRGVSTAYDSSLVPSLGASNHTQVQQHVAAVLVCMMSSPSTISLASRQHVEMSDSAASDTISFWAH